VDSHVDKTAIKLLVAADKAAQNKIDKYARLDSTHTFYLFAIETVGTTFLFQRLSMALQMGNAVSFQDTMITE